jgi:hypothetical protein
MKEMMTMTRFKIGCSRWTGSQLEAFLLSGCHWPPHAMTFEYLGELNPDTRISAMPKYYDTENHLIPYATLWLMPVFALVE